MTKLTRWFLLSTMVFGVVEGRGNALGFPCTGTESGAHDGSSGVISPAIVYLQRKKFDINKAVKWGMILCLGTAIPLMLILAAVQFYSSEWRDRMHGWAYESTAAPYTSPSSSSRWSWRTSGTGESEHKEMDSAMRLPKIQRIERGTRRERFDAGLGMVVKVNGVGVPWWLPVLIGFQLAGLIFIAVYSRPGHRLFPGIIFVSGLLVSLRSIHHCTSRPPQKPVRGVDPALSILR